MAAALVAGVVYTSASAATASAGSDAELIQVCQQFAETELEAWYRYLTAPADLADDQDWVLDFATLHWITRTQAATAEGWHAKALAYAAYHRDAFDDDPQDRDTSTSLLAALLRDMITPARAAIIARLAQKYGPLPVGYAADGTWLGAEAGYGADSMWTGAEARA